jgi:hypothetical protein
LEAVRVATCIVSRRIHKKLRPRTEVFTVKGITRLKNLLLFAGCFVALQAASASPICVNGSLASYEALGAGGCSIGLNTVASFGNVSGTTGATEINPALITIMPTGGTTNPGLTFGVNETATVGALDEAIFTYLLTGAVYSLDVTTLSGSSETGNGAVTEIQNDCVGGMFGPDGVTGCTGSVSGSLVLLDGIQNTDQTSLPGPSLLAITDDLTIDSGGTGSASGAVFMDQFTATTAAPEPAAYVLTFLGLAFVGVRKFHSFNRNL